MKAFNILAALLVSERARNIARQIWRNTPDKAAHIVTFAAPFAGALAFMLGLGLWDEPRADPVPGYVWTWQGATLGPNWLPVTGSGLGNVTASGSFVVGNLYSVNSTNGQATIDSGIAAANLATLTGTQTLTNKTLTSPTINSGVFASGALSGSFSGNPIFTGTPIFSALSSGTCALNLVLDSGNHLVTTACSSGGGSGTVTNVATGTGLTGGPITTTGTVSCVTFSSSLVGCVPASGGGTTNFLRADGTWATPAGAGTVTSVGLSVPATSIFGVTGSPVTSSGTLGLTTTGTSGGIPYFSSTSQLASSALLTANLPVIGGGAGVAPTVGTRSGNTTQFVTTTGAQTSGNCVQIDASGNHVASGSGCSGGTPVGFVGAIGGTSTAYTMASPTPSGFSLTGTLPLQVCGTFSTANGNAPTLAVNSTAALPIVVDTAAGLVAVGPNAWPSTAVRCFNLDSAHANYVLQNQTLPAAPITTGGTLTAPQFASCQPIVITTSSQTLTLPAATTVAPGGCYNIQTQGVLVTVMPQAGDAINGGTNGASVVIGSNITTAATSSGSAGATAWTLPTGQRTPFTMSWKPGTDLSTAASGMGRAGGGDMFVAGIFCNIQVAAGSAMTLDVYATASGNAPNLGTKLTTTACNLNSAGNADQGITPLATTIPGNSNIWAVATTGTSTASSGMISVVAR